MFFFLLCVTYVCTIVLLKSLRNEFDQLFIVCIVVCLCVGLTIYLSRAATSLISFRPHKRTTKSSALYEKEEEEVDYVDGNVNDIEPGNTLADVTLLRAAKHK